jgi:dihydrodipicolinate synthase/N-acetylneuraminate lyase
VLTPVGASGGFHGAAFSRLLGRVFDAGCDGIYVCGFSGEGLELSVAQRRAVAEAAIAATPAGRRVVIHVGSRDREEAFELAGHAAAAGAHALASLPPFDGGGRLEDERAYFARLCPLSAAAVRCRTSSSCAQSPASPG